MGSLSDNTGAWPELRARNDAERTAVVAGNLRLTDRELADRVARVSGALEGAGARRGDRVAAAPKNRVEALPTSVSATVSKPALRRGLGDAPVRSSGR